MLLEEVTNSKVPVSATLLTQEGCIAEAYKLMTSHLLILIDSVVKPRVYYGNYGNYGNYGKYGNYGNYGHYGNYCNNGNYGNYVTMVTHPPEGQPARSSS